MKDVHPFVLLNIILVVQIGSVCSVCTMPTAWLGSWYQRGMTSLLEITLDQMRTKGVCLDALPSQQYYLFLDRSTRCARCLVFIQRHVNLLQYRESECNDLDDSLNVVSCPNLIAPDAALYTLHRDQSRAQLCPIQTPFQLVNLIKEGSACQQAMTFSYIHECADPYRFHLHLAPCSSYQSILDFHFVCVGMWIEDFHTYFVARILTDQHPTNRHACFRFLTKEKSSSILALHMATDDSCRDLYSKQMSTVITLSTRRRQMHEECTFPKTFQSHDWHSINGTMRMVVRSDDIEFVGRKQRYHCEEMIHQNASTSLYRIRSFTHCSMSHACLRITQRAENVLEMQTSSLSGGSSCNHLHERKSSHYETFFTRSLAPARPCPSYVGRLVYQAKLGSRLQSQSLQMSVGCDKREQLTLFKQRTDLESRSTVQIDTCLASWQSEDSVITYLIVQSSYSNLSYCLSFQMTDPILIRNDSNTCSFHHRNATNPISLYSARLFSPCSQVSQFSCGALRLSITIFVAINLLVY